MYGLLRFIVNMFRIAQHMVPEDYELSICLTDKNNIVIYQETKILEDFKQVDIDWIINEIKNFGNEDEKGDNPCIDVGGEVVCLNEN